MFPTTNLSNSAGGQSLFNNPPSQNPPSNLTSLFNNPSTNSANIFPGKTDQSAPSQTNLFASSGGSFMN
jgi:hypothetical protein